MRRLAAPVAACPGRLARGVPRARALQRSVRKALQSAEDGVALDLDGDCCDESNDVEDERSDSDEDSNSDEDASQLEGVAWPEAALYDRVRSVRGGVVTFDGHDFYVSTGGESVDEVCARFSLAADVVCASNTLARKRPRALPAPPSSFFFSTTTTTTTRR